MAIAAAFDGTSVWVTAYGPSTVTKLRTRDGKVLGTFAVGRAPIGLAYDGANVWVANSADGTVTKLRASDGKTIGTFGGISGNPYGIAFDGANIWVSTGITLAEFRASDGKKLGEFSANGGSTGVAFDGANIWVAIGLGNYVLKFLGGRHVLQLAKLRRRSSVSEIRRFHSNTPKTQMSVTATGDYTQIPCSDDIVSC